MATLAAIDRDSGLLRQTGAHAAAVVSVECAPREWTEYVLRHVDATGYHEWVWRDVIERAFGCRPLYFAARRGAEIVGVLPTVLLNSWLFGRSLVSLPFLNYGGVLADDDGAARALLTAAIAAAREHRCRHVELRHFVSISPICPASVTKSRCACRSVRCQRSGTVSIEKRAIRSGRRRSRG
jgi:hypothetical protein